MHVRVVLLVGVVRLGRAIHLEEVGGWVSRLCYWN